MQRLEIFYVGMRIIKVLDDAWHLKLDMVPKMICSNKYVLSSDSFNIYLFALVFYFINFKC